MFASVLMRIGMKIIADFTGMMLARHPYEMGGAYWLFNMVYTQTSVFVVLMLRAKKDMDDDDWMIQQKELQMIALALLGLWMLAFAMLLKFSEKGFHHTFYQPTKACEYNKARFDTGVDSYMISIFEDHESYYTWYEGEIKEWLEKVWDKWHDEKPAWFTEEVMRQIPDDYIPHSSHWSVRNEFLEAESNFIMSVRRSSRKSSGSRRRKSIGGNRRRHSISAIEMLEQAVGVHQELLGEGSMRASVRANVRAMALHALDNAKTICDEKKVDGKEEERKKKLWIKLAKVVYAKRSNNEDANLKHIEKIFRDNEVLVKSLKKKCPHFAVILSHVLVMRSGMKVVNVSKTSTTLNWTEENCRAVGRAVAALQRKRGSGVEALRAWRIQYGQLSVLFDGIEGFEEFMLDIFKVRGGGARAKLLL